MAIQQNSLEYIVSVLHLSHYDHFDHAFQSTQNILNSPVIHSYLHSDRKSDQSHLLFTLWELAFRILQHHS